MAKQHAGRVLTTLAHHIDEEWMREAYRRTRKSGATGVDGVTAAQYERHLDENLRGLLNRAKEGDPYRAPPVKRVYIPKAGGVGERPIGIPSFEDKVLQRAVAMVLEPVYEQEFYDCSYGFRPGRSAHQALHALREGLMEMHGGWVLEIDIKSFFDSVDHKRLREMLGQRVNDGVILRLIGKWLNAGVMEDGCVSYAETGTPQGGVISPLLANIYLHEVLDRWFESDVKPRLCGKAFMVRYADDGALVFENEGDARRVFAVIGRRFEKFGLALHPEKTRLVRFERPPRDGGGRPETFDLLGFTHLWAKSRKGNWVIMRKTASSRMSRAVASIKVWMGRNRHGELDIQHARLTAKMKGHYAYFGITGNAVSLWRFHYWVTLQWHKWLGRRGGRHFNWMMMNRILRRFPLPAPRIHHAV
jgi:group II intron reverse transcriptase/maturase